MSRSVYKISLIFSLTAAMTSAGLNGQTEKQLVPADIKLQTIVTEPVTLSKGFLRIGVIANYRVADRYFTDERKKDYFNYNIWGSKSAFNLNLQYGLNDRMELGIVTEYMYNKLESQSIQVNAGTSTTVQTRQNGIGFGDTRLDLKYQLIPEKKHKVSLTSFLSAMIPTGEKNPKNIKSAEQYDLPVGTGNYSASAELYARTIIYPYSFTGYVKYVYNFSGSKLIYPSDITESHFRFGNRYETGVSINLLLNDWIVLASEINYFYEGRGTINNFIDENMPCNWALSYIPNLVFQVKKFRLSESVSIPVWGRNVPADALFILRMQYIF
jgi:hypothetical protein